MIDFKLEFYVTNDEIYGVRNGLGIHQVYDIKLNERHVHGWVTSPSLYRVRFYNNFELTLPSRPEIILSLLMSDFNET